MNKMAVEDPYTTDNLMSVLVEITTFCNMECTYCIRTIKDDKNKWCNKHLSLEEFKKIVDSLPIAGEIVTQGVGEPTMHPHLPEIIRIAVASKKFPSVVLTTNAMLRKVDYYQQLFYAGLTKLYISVDSLEHELANRMRAGTSIKRLKEIIVALTGIFPGKIAIRTTVGSENIHTIPALLQGLDALGQLDVFMHPYDDIGNPHGCISPEQSAQFERDIVGLSQPFQNLRVVANSFVPAPEVCIHPWRIPAITVDGDMVPCCRTMDKNIFTFGNVLENSFEDIWSSEKAKSMRTSFLSESPSFCGGCPRYVERYNGYKNTFVTEEEFRER